MTACRHLFVSMALLVILGAACTGSSSDDTREGGGGTGTSGDTSATGGAGPSTSGGATGSSSGGTGGSTSRTSTGSGGATALSSTGCTPDQLAARVASKYTVLAWDDLPEDIRIFMTSFLPLSYIQDHFRLYSTSPYTETHGEIHLQVEYGCETAVGFIEWSGTCKDGRTRILYWTGPSQSWQVKVERAEVVRRMTDAGCDTKNLALSFRDTITSPIPGVLDCDGLPRYSAASLVWVAGRQETTCDDSAPSSRCICYKPQCELDADTGALKTSPATYSCPACEQHEGAFKRCIP